MNEFIFSKVAGIQFANLLQNELLHMHFSTILLKLEDIFLKEQLFSNNKSLVAASVLYWMHFSFVNKILKVTIVFQQ